MLDANILLYAYDSDSAQHATCLTWLEAALNDEESVALPWQTILAFVRIATNARAVRRPLTGAEACAIVGSWLQRPNVVILDAGERFWEIFEGQVVEAQVSGPLVTGQAAAVAGAEGDATETVTLCVVDPPEPVQPSA